MKKDNYNQDSRQGKSKSRIPDIDIIDLDSETIPEQTTAADDSSVHYESLDSDYVSENGGFEPEDDEFPAAAKKRFKFNMHHALLIAVIVFIGAIVFKFANWGVRISQDEIFKDGAGIHEDTMDSILPLIRADGTHSADTEEDTILLFGNAPFADDRDSKDGLANMIADKTGATVYNCAVSGSYLASVWPYPSAQDSPIDAFNFYWMCLMTSTDELDGFYQDSCTALGADCPPEAAEVFETLKNVDFNTVDVIGIMYDGSDYLAGHPMYSDQNSTDVQQFTGNMEAGIEFIKDNFPNIRIIVMSPTYAYGIDENGEYISSDIQTYGQDVLSTYSIKQYDSASNQSVTFVDNLYGTITEDSAPDYLKDNLHLNKAGREKVAERFIYALNYFNREDQ